MFLNINFTSTTQFMQYTVTLTLLNILAAQELNI